MAPQIILTTGANQGLGFSIVEVITDREPSAIQILTCRNVNAGNKALEKLRQRGIQSRIEVLELDVTNDDHIIKAVKHVETKYGRLDVLINNAGIGVLPPDNSLSALRKAYTSMCSTNLSSVAIMTTAFLPLLYNSSDPKVINISSGTGSIQNCLNGDKMPHIPSYGGIKIGLNGMMAHMQMAELDRSAAVASTGAAGGATVRFYVVSPGLLKTALTGFREGARDPKRGAEVVVRLALNEEGTFEGGTFWSFEEGEMRKVPW
ncbi:MAG: hypothetical protein MMC33_001580 [Icmadophila ericetorum]|nr:hypothetical protein [Icmadophila ericetorum]